MPLSEVDCRGAAIARSSGFHTRYLMTLLLFAALLVARTAGAQRANENAVTAAADAFGNTVGFQTIGLYSPINARGFSPTQAQNLRIEGLYFDQQTTYANPFLFSRSDMRVGIAAQSYSFPSPTGIADYKLRIPGDTSLVSAVITRGPLNMSTFELDAQYPLVKDTVSVFLSVADWSDFDYNYARTSGTRAISMILRLRPNADTEIVPFVGYTHNGEHRELPSVYSNGVDALPLFNEQQLTAQNWTSWGWNQLTAGIIERSSLGSSWKLTVGLFRSVAQDAQNFNDLLLGLMPNGVADHLMDVPPPFTASSYSGDVRLAWFATNGAHAHELTFAARGRQVTRDFGGDSTPDLGPGSIYGLSLVSQPVLEFSAESRDDVRQTGVGASYNERWQGVGTLSLGALKTNYSRTLTTPGVPTVAESSTPLLPNASFTVDAGTHATFYASYTRGLEDSVYAPTSAVNRGEPPPATETWQADGGVRIAPVSGTKVLLGVFKVHKPYFNLNTADYYERLGDISSRGLEGSVTVNGGTPGLSVVAGIVVLRPEVDRRVPALGGAGTVPVGPVPRTININVDYAPPKWGGWAGTVQWTSLSSRVEVNNDQIELPPLSTLGLSARYKLNVGHRAFSVRLDAANVTNARGLTISPLYNVYPQLRRNYTLTLAMDI
jgi:iron complex outermembrane recepter protein